MMAKDALLKGFNFKDLLTYYIKMINLVLFPLQNSIALKPFIKNTKPVNATKKCV